MTHVSKRIITIAIIIVALLLVGAAFYGVVKSSETEPIGVKPSESGPNNGATSAEEQPSLSYGPEPESADRQQVTGFADWVEFTDDEVQIRFQYPAAWGPVAKRVEYSWEGSAGCAAPNRQYTISCIGIAYYFKGLSDGESLPIFLSLKGSEHTVPPRGAYWGDLAIRIRDEEYVQALCADAQDACILLRTQGGPLAARIIDRASDFPTTFPLEGRLKYYIYPGLPQLNGGIILSSERLVEKTAPKEDVATAMDYLVKSIDFVSLR